jgi:hypothetical protein
VGGGGRRIVHELHQRVAALGDLHRVRIEQIEKSAFARDQSAEHGVILVVVAAA